MVRDEAFSGSIDYLQVLDADGTVDSTEDPGLPDDMLQDIYYHMVLGRTFDRKAISLQRQGRIGTFPSMEGQEAAQAASGLAMDADDWFAPSYREHLVNMTRDIPLEQLFLYWSGDERGTQKEGRNLPESVPVASQLPHAAGIALGEAIDDTESAVVAYCGDGGTSEGAFHSGLNWAGALDLPAVFFVQNNQYAISMPCEEQTGSETIAQKALAYGIDGIQVDGNDPLAVYKATDEALDRARTDNQPTLIEAVTYRRGNHTTADDASRYRDDDEEAAWKEKDPIARFETYLQDQGVADANWFDEQRERARNAVEDAVDAYEAMGDQDVDDLFDHQFADLPPELERQKEQARDRYGGER